MLKARDVFDLAAVFAAMPEDLDLVAASSLLSGDDYARARLRIETLHDRFGAEIPLSVNPTEFGRTFIGNACDIALLTLKRLEYGPSTRRVPGVCATP
jgi:hypothetical protein